MFQNFADPDRENWPAAYYGPNFGRSMRVTTRYETQNVFRSEQT